MACLNAIGFRDANQGRVTLLNGVNHYAGPEEHGRRRQRIERPALPGYSLQRAAAG